MMLKLVDASQKFIILGIFILDKVRRLRALLDPPGWCLGIYRLVPLGPESNRISLAEGTTSIQDILQMCAPLHY